MILALTVVAFLLTGSSSRIPLYSLDGAGKSIHLYVGTYIGYHSGRAVVRWEIDVIGGRVYATDIVPGVARGCMIAEPFKNDSREGLFLVGGTPFAYTYEYGGRSFGVDDMPVLWLEAGGLVVKTDYEGGFPSTTEHIKRVSTHPKHEDMYGLRDGVRESCIPDPQPNSIYWVAFSKSAYSIAGNVKFTPSRMVFGNGKSITIQYFGTHPIVAFSDL